MLPHHTQTKIQESQEIQESQCMQGVFSPL